MTQTQSVDPARRCEFCHFSRPMFETIEFGGGQLDTWRCTSPESKKTVHDGTGCPAFLREPGSEGDAIFNP